jgi:hypothetical protein
MGGGIGETRNQDRKSFLRFHLHGGEQPSNATLKLIVVKTQQKGKKDHEAKRESYPPNLISSFTLPAFRPTLTQKFWQGGIGL